MYIIYYNCLYTLSWFIIFVFRFVIFVFTPAFRVSINKHTYQSCEIVESVHCFKLFWESWAWVTMTWLLTVRLNGAGWADISEESSGKEYVLMSPTLCPHTHTLTHIRHHTHWTSLCWILVYVFSVSLLNNKQTLIERHFSLVIIGICFTSDVWWLFSSLVLFFCFSRDLFNLCIYSYLYENPKNAMCVCVPMWATNAERTLDTLQVKIYVIKVS